MTTNELIALLYKSFGKNSKAFNYSSKKAFEFSRHLNELNETEKINMVLPLIEFPHVFVKYWGCIIALSHNILKEKSIVTLLQIMDIDTKSFDKPLDLNVLKADIGSDLYDYKKYGVVRSYPEQYSYEPSDFPNYKFVIKHYKRKYKNLLIKSDVKK